jgi:hypothetical protein
MGGDKRLKYRGFFWSTLHIQPFNIKIGFEKCYGQKREKRQQNIIFSFFFAITFSNYTNFGNQ